MRRVATLAAGAVVAAFAARAAPQVFARVGVDDPPLAPDAIKPLEAVARDVAKAGRGSELDELLDVLLRAGLDVPAHHKLADAARSEAAKVRKPLENLPSAAKSLKRIASDLGARLPACSDVARPLLAKLILQLDSECEVAQRALGRERVGGCWMSANDKARSERKAAILSVLAEARQLDVSLDVRPSSDPYIAVSRQKEPHVVSFGAIHLHGIWPVEKLERVLREALRAVAVDQFLISGKLSIPELQGRSIVCFDEQREYVTATQLALQKRGISAADAKEAPNLSATIVGDEDLTYAAMESEIEAYLHAVFVLYHRGRWMNDAGAALSGLQSGPRVGLSNWTSLTYLGTRIPIVVVTEDQNRSGAQATTVGVNDGEKRLRERLLLLSDAGIAGGRAWLQFLAERREDPPLASILVDQVGRLQGNDLLKATFVVEMLAQDGPLLSRMKKMPDSSAAATRSKAFEEACGESTERLEAEWREWFVPQPTGLAQRLGATLAADAITPAEQQTLERLNATRKRAGLDQTPVDFDRATTDNCRRHALYLAQNPDQVAHWPAAHEEYPDRPGFDPAGSSAGTRSVIAPGVKDGRDAVDGWMATYYHRLPLLDPGLVRIGFALENHCAVLDCASFVQPRAIGAADATTVSRGDPTYWAIVWPPANGSDVPTCFRAELPEPIPGEESSKMGYPITFQLKRRFASRVDVGLTLHAGTTNGAAIPCWFATPTAPTNPKLAPDNCWCLIPKKPLQPGAAYAVTGTIEFNGEIPVSDAFSWTFHCGK